MVIFFFFLKPLDQIIRRVGGGWRVLVEYTHPCERRRMATDPTPPVAPVTRMGPSDGHTPLFSSACKVIIKLFSESKQVLSLIDQCFGSGNVDPDPGSKIKMWWTHIQINQNYKNIFFLKYSLILFNIREYKLKITTTKNIVMSSRPFTEKN